MSWVAIIVKWTAPLLTVENVIKGIGNSKAKATVKANVLTRLGRQCGARFRP